MNKFKDIWVEGTGLIIPTKTGVEYTNQTGGISCHHRTEEGFFIPFGEYGCFAVVSKDKDVSVVCLQDQLDELFCGSKYNCWCNDGIDLEDADYIDNLLKDFYVKMTVDRTRLQDDEEAWVYMDIHSNCNDTEINGMKGVLVWENSD
jgi:hypothetical protein